MVVKIAGTSKRKERDGKEWQDVRSGRPHRGIKREGVGNEKKKKGSLI